MMPLKPGRSRRDGSGTQRAGSTATAPTQSVPPEDRLRAIARLTRRTVGSTPLAIHARELAQEVREVFHVDACVIRLLDGENLVLLASCGLPPESAHPSLPIGWGISQEILSTRRPLFIPNVSQHAQTASVRHCVPQPYLFTSYAGAPMLAGDEVIGILGLFCVEPREDFTAAELDCLQILASSISVAVANERLYQQVVAHRDRLQDEISKRARVEQLLRESEGRLRLAARTGRMFAFEWDAITDQITRSEDCSSILGISENPTNDTAERCLTQIHPDDRSALRGLIRSLNPQQFTYASTYRFVRSDGQIVWLEESGHAFFDEAGRLTRIIGMSVDISDRIRRDEENQKLREELAHIARVTTMGELAATIAHEVNQPLGAIIGNAQASERLLSANEPDLQEVRAALKDIVHDGRRATAVIDRVRTFLRRGNQERKPLDINRLIHEVTRLLGGPLTHGKIEVRFALSENLPRVSGNLTELQQVLLNLVLNAIESITQSGRSPRLIRLLSEAAADGIVVSVIDSGAGLPVDASVRVFDPFFTTKARGMGLGLTISRSIVENHGGRLWAEPVPDGGAAFHFLIPARMENSDEQHGVRRR